MIALIRKWLGKRRESSRRNEVNQLRALFSVEDHNGKLWLLCDGIAFAILSDDSSAVSTVDMIEECRRAAIAHRYGLSSCPEAEAEGITILENFN